MPSTRPARLLLSALLLLPSAAAVAHSTAPPTPAAEVASPPPLRLDGLRDEWQGREPAATDPRGDAIAGAIDFGRLWVSETPDAVWMLIEISEQPVNAQSHPASIEIALDVDADARRPTGETWSDLAGADLVLRFSPLGEEIRRPGQGAIVQLLRRNVLANAPQRSGFLSTYDVGVGMAPTYASPWIELRFPRATSRASDGGIRFGDAVRVQARVVDSQGRVLDQTPVAAVDLRLRPQPAVAVNTALPAPSPGELRTLSWNLEHGGHLTTPPPFARLLRAVEPSLLLLQELSPDESAETLEAWLNEHLPNERPWRAVVSGGRMPVGVAFAGAIEAVPGLDPVRRPMPGGDRAIRGVGGIVEFGGRRVLAVSVHLKCCGSIGSSEDATREAEVAAIRDAIREAVERHAADRRIEGIVVGGDFNLVGSREILLLASERIDLDGSDLKTADLASPDGRFVQTWGHERSPFMPGQLDFLLYSNSTLERLRGLVIDARAMLGGEGSFSGPSDHRPLVGDFAWRPAATSN